MTDEALHEARHLDRRAPIYQMAFEEAGRALDAQERAVNELRSRRGVLMAAATVATSFFGGQAIDGHRSATPIWVAISAFVLIGAAVLAVLWPRHDWEFSPSASEVIAEYAEPVALPTALIHRDLALHRAQSYRANARQLRWLFRAFRIGLLALVVETGAWLVAIAHAF